MEGFLNKFFLLEVLDLQNYRKDNTESVRIPYSQFPLLLTSYISMIHLSQLMKKYQYIIIN